jgi:hypothetical protein
MNETIFDHDPMKCDGVGVSQIEYCIPFDYDYDYDYEHEHRFAEHEHGTGQEPEHDDVGEWPIVREWNG